MTIPVTCSACNAKYQLGESDAGQQVECACGQLIYVPEAETLTPLIRFQCPHCADTYQVEAELGGEVVECVCGQKLIVPPASTSAFEELPNDHTVSTSESRSTNETSIHSSALPPELPHLPPVPSAAPSSTSSTTSDIIDDGTQPTGASHTATGLSTSDATIERPNKQQLERARADSKRVPPKVLIAGVAIAVVVVAAIGIYLWGDSADTPKPGPSLAVSKPPEPSSEVTQVVEAQKTDAPAPAPARVSLAERMQQAQASPSGGTSDKPLPPNNQAAENIGAAAGDTEPSDPRTVSSSNPYEGTDADRFIALAPTKPKQNATSQPAANGGKAAATTTEKEDTKPAVATSRSIDTAAKDVSGSHEPGLQSNNRRILFVSPKKTYRSFDRTAKEAFRQFNELRGLKQKAESGKSEDTDAWEHQLAITGGLLRETQRNIDRESDMTKVLRIQLLLAWCYLESRQFYEAAVLSVYLAKTTPEDMVIQPEPPAPKPETQDTRSRSQQSPPDSVGARLVNAELKAKPSAKKDDASSQPQDVYPKKEAATLALKALIAAYSEAPPDNRTVEYQQIVGIAKLINGLWPDIETMDEIRLYVAQLHAEFSAEREAADWFQLVSTDSPEHARAQLAAGQIFNSLYLKAKRTTDTNVAAPGARPAPLQTLDELQNKTQQLLKNGIALASGDLRENAFLAKLTLARIMIDRQQFEAAVKIIAQDPDSLVAAVTGDPGSTRPETGIRSVPFTSAVLQSLARAHLGSNNVDDAVATLNELESISKQIDGSTADLLLLSCEKLAEQFQDAVPGTSERPEILTKAALLLQTLVEHSRSLSAAALLKAATIASGLADQIDAKDDAAVLYVTSADLYAALLAVAPDENKAALRYQMAIVLRPAGRFSESLEIFESVLAGRPNVFDAQFEAARTLQAWGTADRDSEKLLIAMNGRPEEDHIWGWRKMAATLQNLMAKDNSKPDYSKRFIEARRAIAECRMTVAEFASADAQRDEELRTAATELKMLATHMKTFDEHELQPLDEIYQQILQQLGRPEDSLIENRPLK